MRQTFLLFVLLSAGAISTADADEKPLRSDARIEKARPNLEREPVRRAITDAFNALKRDDTAAAVAAVDRALADPRFAELPDRWRRDAHVAAGAIALQQERQDDALRHIRAATASPASKAYEWRLLAMLEFERDALEPAAIALTTLADRWPEEARSTDKILIGQLIARLPASSPHSSRLIESLLKAGWAPNVGGESHVAYRLALAQVIAGRRDDARQTLEGVEDADALLKVRVDPRFDGLYDAGSPRWDVGATAQRSVADLRAKSILSPDRLEPVAALAFAMLAVGEHEDLIAVVDEIKDAVARSRAGPPAYRDQDEYLPWLRDYRSIALRRLGRHEEALAELAAAAASGPETVSQVLNLAVLQCSLERPDDALASLDRAGAMSGYGRMVKTLVQQCAALQKGDGEAAAAALSTLRRDHGDTPGVLIEGLLRIGGLDEAATVLIAWLDSPDLRGEALARVQDFREEPPLRGDATAAANSKKLLARTDVQAAIRRAGRVLSVPVYALY
jgi:tetratricopeptide (TPR) repeat protein